MYNYYNAGRIAIKHAANSANSAESTESTNSANPTHSTHRIPDHTPIMVR